jgi:endoglucanase
MFKPRKLKYFLLVGTLMAAIIASIVVPVSAHGGGGGWNHGPFTRFYVPKPNHDAIKQIAQLMRSHDKANARLIGEMILTPQAVWLTAGTPKKVMMEVKNTVKMAAAQRSIPILVAYNIPFRDCAQFSAGGATTVAEYKAWIDGFAAGIGNAQAVVILEPDGLGIIPWYTNRDGGLDWCQPAEADSATASAERFEMLNYAVDALKAKPNVKVYLDGTHSGWLRIDENADRLVKAGVERADGFYLNVSNYQYTVNSEVYGGWVSSCIAYATVVDSGNFGACPNQYWNGGPLPAQIAVIFGEWQGTAMNPYGEWSDDSTDMALNPSGVNQRFINMLGGVAPTTHFVIDTSRNGQGPWDASGLGYPDAQDWCNPPGRGLGLKPTADTGNPLVDAYLWIKIPGESDGACTRGLGVGGETVDPEWGIIDPGAGDWFPQMALQLAQNANP